MRAVDHGTTVRCDHPRVRRARSCTASPSVRTEFGGASGAAPGHSLPVTVSARGDVIAYDGGRPCHWKVAGTALTCGFSVKTGHPRGVRTITPTTRASRRP